jgi:hypothetical protein
MKICLECEGISDTQREHCASCGMRLSDTSAVHFPLRRGEADAANPLLGAVIDGKYQVQGVLGKGGMGTVFRAKHLVSLIPVALKILNPRFSVRVEYRDYFLAEAQKAGRVTHEHAGRILDVGEAEDGTVYIAMEEVHGVTLHECIHGDQRLAPAVVVVILDQICQALAAAHHAGLVHRDLSPRNVMVVVRNGQPFVKILDFGIAKGLPHAASVDAFDSEITLAPTGFASPPYSAPEHLEAKDVDARADLYSLGVLAYEALTQKLPVAGETPQERAESTIRGEIEPLPPISGVPMKLVRLIRVLMSLDPNDRPNSAEEVRYLLRSISQPGSRMLRDVAVLAFIVAVVRFDATGFAAGDLVAEVARDGEPLSVDALGAKMVDGHLVLDRDQSVEYRTFLANLEGKCKGGAVTITFQLKGGAALGVAKVLVDDTDPVITLERDKEGLPGTLNGGSALKISCDDHLAELLLECRVGDRTILGPVDILDRGLDRNLRASVLLQQVQESRAMPEKGVTLILTATDKAGNSMERPLVREFDVDFRVPEVRGGDEVSATLIEKKASLSLELAQPDEGLKVLARVLGGELTTFVPLPFNVVAAKQIDIDIEKELGIDLSTLEEESLELEFQLRDRAGNSSVFTRLVKFYRSKTGLKLVDTERIGNANRLQPLGTGLVWSGAKIEFSFHCNELYKPVRVTIDGSSAGVRLVRPKQGLGRIELQDYRGLDKDARLEITLKPDTLNPTPIIESWDLRIQSNRLVLKLPDTSAARFLSQLTVDNALFEEPNGGTVDQRDWRLDPDDARLLRGSIGWAAKGADVIGLPVRLNKDDKFFENQRLRRGNNVFFLLLRDVFGRDVEVLVGGAPVQRLTSGPMKGAVQVAEFQYRREVARVQTDVLKLEYQQKTRVIFHSDYNFAVDDRSQISLRFQASPVPCVQLRKRGEGTDLIFDLAYREMARASDEDPDSDLLKDTGYMFFINVELRTPAGSLDFKGDTKIAVETTRSSLVQEHIGQRVADADAVLAAIVMVPVLRPLEEFKDRVPTVMRKEGGFLRRREVAVQNLRDCYLQQRELTRAQYWAIVRGFLALPDAQRSKVVCFVNDPSGDGRFSEVGMRPLIYGGDDERWQKEIASDGDSPVTGLSFYQAYVVARMAGQLLFGDPAVFRLPFGVELEVATLGGEDPGVLNGAAGAKLNDLREGDHVVTPLDDEIHGLDFGVREWVMDLPWPVGDSDESRIIVAGILADHSIHVAKSTGFANMPHALRARLQRTGVVRGVTLAEAKKLVDLRTSKKSQEDQPLLSGVPGVVRTIYVKRNGQGLLSGKPHKLLFRIGMRLVGGEAFVKRVRKR